MDKVNKKILVLGGGVAGASLAYFLGKKDYDVTIIEKNRIGGLSRTYYYAGHPYEFGPHVWFWPDDEINQYIRDLTDDELYYIDRKLFSFIEKDSKEYRYPIHFSSISKMPDKYEIISQLKENRDENYKIIEKNMPEIGKCTFREYFEAAIGTNLYEKFMKDYTYKMWNIPGEALQTSMVWADRFKNHYEKLTGYDPLKFEDHTLGKGIPFQIYPKNGWNPVWEKMVSKTNIIKDKVVKINEEKGDLSIKTDKNEYFFKDYYAVINTLDIDLIWGENKLAYTGRMIIPLLIPDLSFAFSEGTESIHYPGVEFQTRVTEIKTITKYKSKDTLILIEIPITSAIQDLAFSSNVLDHAKNNCLFCKRAYPQQSQEMLDLHKKYMDRSNKISNFYQCGRHAEFKYWGMPETVNSAYQLVKNKF